MTGLEDLNQKVIIVVTFTGVLLLIWWYVKAQLAQTTDSRSRGHFRHIESKRLAHASVLSLFEVNNKTVLVLQAKQGASFIEITDTSGKERNDHV